MTFRNRKQAGETLTAELAEYADQEWVVIALEKGGVPVALEVSQGLHLPLDALGALDHLHPYHVLWRQVLLVDDGEASTSQLINAAEELRANGATQLVLALPVAQDEICEELSPLFDKIVCSKTKLDKGSIAESFEDFPTVSEDEARRMLNLVS